jgi:hypothetical protein
VGGQPIHAKIAPVTGFSSEAVRSWARYSQTPICTLSEGLACFGSATSAGYSHEAIVTGGKHPIYLPQFRWINTLLGNLNTRLSGAFHAFNFDEYGRLYLAGYCSPSTGAFHGVDGRTDRQCCLLLHVLHREVSRGRGCLWAINYAYDMIK